MQDMGLHWNSKKCNVLHVKRGTQVQDAVGTKLDQSLVVESLKPGTSYKFLGVQETVTQDERLALECAAKVYLRRLSVIWSSPLCQQPVRNASANLSDVDSTLANHRTAGYRQRG